MEYSDHLPILQERDPELGRAAAGFRTLEHILNWLPRRGVDFAALEMITQDEYSHDLLIPLADKWLGFAMT